MSRKDLQRNLSIPRGGFHTEALRGDRRKCDVCGALKDVRSLCVDIMDGPGGPLRCRDAGACAKRARRKKK